MAENYDLIFGQSASKQYGWSDSDYQNGWQTVGSTPPTAEQFDALQRRSDTKAKELNDRLTPIETNNTHDYRQPSTTYVVGNIAYHASLPTGYYLECMGTGGITSAGDLVITSPNVGNTVKDGTVVWTIRKIADTTEATTTTKGLMSAADKKKLDGVANNANNYSLPAATGSTRGGVTVGSNISLSGDKISLTSSNVTNALGYTPSSTTGANASGDWNINAATATKLKTARKIGGVLFDGTADITLPGVNAAGNQNTSGKAATAGTADTAKTCTGNSATATKLATARSIALTGNATGSATFDGSGNISINTTVNESKHAVKADTATTANTATNATHASSADSATTLNGETPVLAVSDGEPNAIKINAREAIKGTLDGVLVKAIDFQWYNDHWKIGNMRSDATPSKGFGFKLNDTMKTWIDTNGNVNATSFTGSLNGNATTATNADKLDGYHASDLLRTLGGNKTPVITDIFDRAGTIDMSTMSAADKATHKANINKASNMTQNIWNNSTGIRAYGGDYDMNGYNRGTLKLTQSYKNFDKILVVGCNDDGNIVVHKLWDVWELAYAFAHSYRFVLCATGGDSWLPFGSVRTGTNTNYALSTDTVWSCAGQNCGIIGIYGIKF